MLRSRILPAVFFAAPAIALLTARAGFSEPAAEECKARPGATTPRGGHWYYRINRADKHHCWYLGRADLRANAHAAAAPASTSASRMESKSDGEAAGVQAASASADMKPAQAAPAPAAPAPVAFLDSSLAAQKAQMDFGARWPDGLPAAARDLAESEPDTASSGYAERAAEKETNAEMPSWPAVVAAAAQPAFAGEAALNYFSLAGALAIPVLLLVGWAARFTSRPRRGRLRNRWRATAGTTTAVETKSCGDFSWPAAPTDPAHDLKRSLAELIQDLRRTDAAMRSGDVFGRGAGPRRHGVYRAALQAAE